MNRPRIAVMGTFDPKAEEYQYIIDRIGQQEHDDPEGMIDHILLKELIGKLEQLIK